jgi:hypothetical protein
MEGLALLKMCCHCKNVQPLTCFYKNKSVKDGLHLVCKTCKYEYYSKNKEKLFQKITCSCGKTIYKYYLQKDLKTKYHHNLDISYHSIEIEDIA